MTERFNDQHDHQSKVHKESRGHGMRDHEYIETTSLLDRLADAERGEPDAGFESRLIASAKPGVAGSIGPDTAHAAENRSRGLLARSWWMLPVAAALAIGAVLSPSWRSSTPGSASNPLANTTTENGGVMTLASVEQDLDDFLFIDELTDTQSVFAAGDDLTDVGTDGDTTTDETADALLFDFFAGDAL
jgi:hypothetical protein